MNELEDKYQEAICMLAEWCVAIEQIGADWDDWDEHYKDASYRPCLNREEIDKWKEVYRKQYE